MKTKSKEDVVNDFSYEPALLSTYVKHPQGDNLMVPGGYTINENGTYSSKQNKFGAMVLERVCHYPMAMEGYVRDLETGSSMVIIAWLANKKWRRVVVTREAFSMASDITRAAAPGGAPITSANAQSVILYLSAFEAANIARFEEVKGVSRMGWLPDQEGFLVGTNHVTVDGSTPIQSPQNLRDDWGKDKMIFIPTGNEIYRVLAGYRQEGTLKGWACAARIASEYPLALAGLYIALLPPLFQILGADNFVWEWSGKSSAGKTTALALAASIWGQPRMNMDPSIVSSWRVTDTYIERTLATLGDLPFFLDDTRTAIGRMKHGIDPIQVVYDVVSGTTKGRGTLAGTETKRSWRTILMSTGEEPITGETTKLGVFARSWAIYGNPWGDISPEAARRVLDVEGIISENYGVLGPIWIQRLLQKRALWPKWRQVYRDIRDQYGTRGAVGENAGLTGRLGKNIAAIEVCANLANSLIPEVFGWNFRVMLEDLWRWVQSEGAGGMDPALEAILSVRTWAFSNVQKFYPRGKEEPAGGWMGIWTLPTSENLNPGIYIRPEMLLFYLRSIGHPNMKVILDEWARRGWMNPLGRKSKKGSPLIFSRREVKYDDVQIWAIEIHPPIGGAEELKAYDALTKQVVESTESCSNGYS
jgi:putative DNA primase/helicase